MTERKSSIFRMHGEKGYRQLSQREALVLAAVTGVATIATLLGVEGYMNANSGETHGLKQPSIERVVFEPQKRI